MLVVAEATPPALAHACVEHRLAGMAERWVAQVMTETDRLGEVLVQPECARHPAGDPARFERVREPRPIVIALGRDEHLRLVLQAPKGLGVHDPIAVALKWGAMVGVGLWFLAVGGIRARRERRERLFQSLDPLPERGSGELGHARPDCRSSLGERLEARGTDVELVEQEAAGEVGLAARVQGGVGHIVRQRVALLARPGHRALEAVDRGLTLLWRGLPPVGAGGGLELLAERLRRGGLAAAPSQQDRRPRD